MTNETLLSALCILEFLMVLLLLLGYVLLLALSSRCSQDMLFRWFAQADHDADHPRWLGDFYKPAQSSLSSSLLYTQSKPPHAGLGLPHVYFHSYKFWDMRARERERERERRHTEERSHPLTDTLLHTYITLSKSRQVHLNIIRADVLIFKQASARFVNRRINRRRELYYKQ